MEANRTRKDFVTNDGVRGVMKGLKAKEIEVVVYEPVLEYAGFL